MCVCVWQLLWLDEDAIPVNPVSPCPTSPGSGKGEGGVTSEGTPGGSSLSPNPCLVRPQNTSPDADFATEVRPFRGDVVCLLSQY